MSIVDVILWGALAVCIVGAWLSNDPYNGPDCPATCCGCGDLHATVAVWAEGDPAESAEGYCLECYLSTPARGGGFWPGCTAAVVDPGTWSEWDVARLLAYPHRRPVPANLTRPVDTP